LDSDISARTRSSYASGVRKYLDYMNWHRNDPQNPTEEQLCNWLGYESYFIEPLSISKYATAVRYYLNSLGKGRGDVVKGGLVDKLIVGIAKTYGLPPVDDRTTITASLLTAIARRVNLGDHNERCLMAASSVAFVCCLRCGEFTVSDSLSHVLKKRDWKQDEERGEIFLAKSKTDFFGRGQTIRFRKMKSLLSPVGWMHLYAYRHTFWSSPDDPLFMLKNGKALDRKTLISWIREKAKEVGFSGAQKINGISFRRGGAQALRDQGYQMNQFGVLGRWKTVSSAARYVQLTNPVVDEFAAAFDRAAQG
jgi:hypothetical protein